MASILGTIMTVIIVALIIAFLVYPAYIAFKSIRKK